jgi:hypothetical protein
MMHDRGQSDSSTVPEKPSNNAEGPAAEVVAGVLVVGRTWDAGASRHRYLVHPIVAQERPGADLCLAVQDQEPRLFVPPLMEG